MHVTGTCHCGRITFSAEVDENKVIVCHCTDCQIIASSAFRVGALVSPKTFSINGPVKEYSKVGTSGSVRKMVFCPECSTNIYSYMDGVENHFFSLRLGAVHQFHELQPKLQIWRQSALPWLDHLTTIPACAEQAGIAEALGNQAQQKL